MIVPNNVGPLAEWLFQHLSLIGWPAVVYFAWRASKWLTVVTHIATKTVDQVDKMATDHFPAMRNSLEKQDGLLHSVDQSLKTMVDKMMPAQFATAQTAVRKRKK